MNILIKLSELEKNTCGRHTYTEEGALALSWSASGFEVRFRAERLGLHFVPDYHADQPCYIKMTLDGGRSQKFAVSTGAEVALLEDIPEGEHTLKVCRLSAGDCLLKLSALELEGEAPEILPAPEPSDLRIEFIGDSITCGYGDMAGRDVNAYYTYHEDTTKTYAYLTASALGADMRVEAISGQGIVKNCRGEEGYRIPCFFEHELRVGRRAHDFGGWVPQVVVINAGTNDQGGRVDKADFAREAGRFLDRIREVYPDAEIFWVYGMMGLVYDAELRETISSRDARMHYVPIRPIYEFAGEVGANGHPNERGQARAAAILTESIKAALKMD